MSQRLKPPLHSTSSPRDNEPDDLEKLKKWQEDRIARKLRGEYESAVLNLSELISTNMSSNMNISAVRVEGAKITRSSFLEFLINPLLASSTPKDAPCNLESVLHSTRKLAYILHKTDIFKSVDAKIEQARNSLANAHDVDIVFNTREKGRYYLNTSTELGNNEGSATATGRIRNVFGGAEIFEANIALGTKTRKSFRASLTAPITSDLDTHAEMMVFGLERDCSTYASCSEGTRGVKVIVRNGTVDRGAHEVAYEAIVRNIDDLTPTASISMRESAGQTLKSSLSHSYVIDTRDDRITATRGEYAKIRHEFAGLGGDASFYKTELEGQVSRPIVDGVSFSLAGRTGLLWGLLGPTLFSDRFQLGGPTSVRAFKANSMGPQDGSDSLGGDFHWSAGASIIADIPRKPHWPVKTHLWVNAGRLDAVDKGLSLVDNVRNTLSRPSISAGLGLIYRFDPVRVEVNFGVPLVASKSDGMRRGLQVGMGLEFL